MNPSNNFFVKQAIWSYLLLLLGMITATFVTCFSNYTNCLFAFVLYVPFPLILIWFTKFIADTIMNTSKKKIGRGWVITIAIIMYVLKYIIAIVPLFVGFLINIGLGNQIFNTISLICVALIYPTSSLIAQFGRIKK